MATARSIIVLAEATNADLSDTRVLRVLLSLRGVPKLDGHVVAEISDLDNNLQVRLSVCCRHMPQCPRGHA